MYVKNHEFKRCPHIPKGYEKFWRDLKKKCRENNIRIVFTKDKKVYLKGENKYEDGVSGIFAETIIMVTTYQGMVKAFQLLVHESCHVDQFLEDKKKWREADHGYEETVKWELDCEKRAVEKIKKYKLPIDIKIYSKKANYIIYSYIYSIQTKKEIELDSNYEGLEHCPDILFEELPTEVPEALRKIFKRKEH